MHIYFRIILLSVLLYSCSKKDTLFEKLSSSKTNIYFNNKITITDSLNVLKFEYIYNGAGVGVGDFNNDGLSDVFFAGNQVSSKLYLNKGDMKFDDITVRAKVATNSWCTGVSVVDINQDGRLDIFVSNISTKYEIKVPKLLFINQGNDVNGIPIFKESAKEVGLADESYGTQAAFLDYDLDGDLDMYLLTNAIETFNRNNSIGQRQNGEGRSVDKLYKNIGNTSNGLPRFKDVSKEAGILTEGWGLGLVVNDFNNDGYPDIYAGNDFLSNDHLYINNKNGTFTNKVSEYFRHQSHNSMGLDMADINNDGLNDLAVVDMLPDDNLRIKTMFNNIDYDRFQENLSKKYQPQYVHNVLQVNNGNQSFSDIGYLAGIAATDWSWSPLIADFDNDGLRDILITNGYRLDVTDLDFIVYRGDDEVFGKAEERAKKMKEAFAKLEGVKKANFLFKNQGNYQFENIANNQGLDHKTYTNGTAYADLDNDGDLDLVMNNIDDEAFIYKNNSIELPSKNRNYIRFKLSGEKPNAEAYGAKITIYYNGNQQFAEHQTVRGFKTTVENFVHFGLGNISKIDSLKIVWPKGSLQLLKNVNANQTLIVNEKEANLKSIKIENTEIPIFNEVSKKYNIDLISDENDFNDFLIQHTLPHKHSDHSPKIAVGDVNGDKLEDFFIGGASHRKGVFFIQNKNSKFFKKEFLEKTEEDAEVIFVDFDKDNDLDLYCVSGSSEFNSNTIQYQDRIYINDGKGNFKKSENLLPKITSSGSCIKACDYDKDGDIDLFRGGRIMPTEYPYSPESYLLENNGKGIFSNNTKLAKELEKIGMITDATWADFDNDSWQDLILVGEFMPITVFKNNRGKFFTKINSKELSENVGWFYSINKGDFDNDGDVDFVVGNLGLNSSYKASKKEPLTVYAKDFDNNGIIDPLITQYNYGKEYLVHPRGVLIDQLIAMRKRFNTFKQYGETVFENAIPEVDLKGATILKANNFASLYIENKENEKFEMHQLPIETQFSTINSTLVMDFNHDGNLDLLAIGNDYSPDALTGRLDASIGNYLIGNGKGKFENSKVKKSGFYVNGNARSINKIKLSNGKFLILVARNDDKMLAFE
jgi:enediyne biosynthesis protein E4